jgi:hypothetical protein
MLKLGKAPVFATALAVCLAGGLFAQAPAAAPIKRTADGKPDLSGIWQGGGISLTGGPTGNIVSATAAPAAPAAGGRGAGGAGGAGGGRGAAPGGGGGRGAAAPGALPTQPPMQQWAIDKVKNYKNIDDPTVHCYMPGIPRVVGMPFPLEIVQTPGKVVILYEAFRTFRVIPTDGKPLPGEGIAGYNGDSVGHWEGDTLVVDVTNFNGKIWGPGNMKVTSTKYHVVEKYHLEGDTLVYETTIEDPEVLTGPFAPPRTVLRHPSPTRIMEYECLENNINLNTIIQ